MSLKKEIILMADAHLKNVESIIKDLEKQKETISHEINRLRDYLELGTNNIEMFSQEKDL